MIRQMTAGVLCAALLAGAGAWARAAAVAGVVIAIEGKPEIQSKGKEGYKKLRRGQMVYEGDTLKTGPGQQLAIAFTGGAEFRMNENSVFEVESGGSGRQATSLKTKIGQAWTRMLHGLSGVNVKTPMAVAAVRGTEADIDLDERLRVKVYEGHVDVMNEQGKQTLRAGQMTDVGSGGAPAAPRAMGQGDYGSWQNELKPEDVEDNLKKLQKEAERTKTLKFNDSKTGETIEIPVKKKD